MTTYTAGDGEVVGRQRFRILKFKPDLGSCVSFRLAPSTSPDTQFFWDGLKEHQLLIQRCASCATLRHPPRPMCPSCNALGWDTVEASGRGDGPQLRHAAAPAVPVSKDPYIVVLVELEEGTR